jgi:hypothetical protein
MVTLHFTLPFTFYAITSCFNSMLRTSLAFSSGKPGVINSLSFCMSQKNFISQHFSGQLCSAQYS